MDAPTRYSERVDAFNAQVARMSQPARERDRWDRLASRFTMDPRRDLDPNLAIIAEYVQPDDVIVDVGGGAGRVSLPLALRAREVINVDPSPGMCAAFEASARKAGITNARAVHDSWPADGVVGDITLVFNVTYFVREIVPFVEALVRAARRRVIIGVWSVPPPSQDLALFERVHGERGEAVPDHRLLLPVLWEMGILPEIRVLPNEFRFGPTPQTRDEAIAFALDRLDTPDGDRTRRAIVESFDDLFEQRDSRFYPRWRPRSREMLITWETHSSPGASVR